MRRGGKNLITVTAWGPAKIALFMQLQFFARVRTREAFWSTDQ